RCHECGALEGQLHKLGCFQEVCAECGNQLISCGHFRRNLPRKRRAPFILWPNVCARCGTVMQSDYGFTDEDWDFYIEPAQRANVVCPDCFELIRAWTNERSARPLPTQTNLAEAVVEIYDRLLAIRNGRPLPRLHGVGIPKNSYTRALEA